MEQAQKFETQKGHPKKKADFKIECPDTIHSRLI